MAGAERDTSFDLNDDADDYGYAPNLDLPVPTPAAPGVSASPPRPPMDVPPVGLPAPAGGAVAFLGFLQAPQLDLNSEDYDEPARPTISREPDPAPPAVLAEDLPTAVPETADVPLKRCPDNAPESGEFAKDVEQVLEEVSPARPKYRLPESVRDAAARSGLFALLRRIDAIATHGPRLGESMHPAQDVVRIWQRPTTAFAPADVESLAAIAPDRAERLTVNALGLFGAGGPLPLVYLHHIEERLAWGDSTLADFINALTHRLATIRYRAWADHQRVVQHDRPANDPFLNQVLSLIGLGAAELRNADKVPDPSKAFMAGRLAMPARNPEGLCAILSWFFDVPCEVKEFVPTQITLPDADRRSVGGQRPAVLGRHAPLGRSAWQAQQKFHVILGPMTLTQYERLLPDQVGLRQVRDWVKMYLGVELEWDVRLTIQRAQVPKPKLGQYGRLGWTTWLANKPAQRDRSDLVIPSSPAKPRVKPPVQKVTP